MLRVSLPFRNAGGKICVSVTSKINDLFACRLTKLTSCPEEKKNHCEDCYIFLLKNTKVTFNVKEGL